MQGYSPLEAGVRTLPWTAAPMVVAPIAGLLAPRTGLRALLLAGLVLQAGSLVWLAILTEGGYGYSSFVPALAMAGVGMGLTFAPSATAVLDGLPESEFAMASSANSTVREFGVALGVAVLTAVFLGNGGQLDPDRLHRCDRAGSPHRRGCCGHRRGGCPVRSWPDGPGLTVRRRCAPIGA